MFVQVGFKILTQKQVNAIIKPDLTRVNVKLKGGKFIMFLFLVTLGGTAWTIVYIGIIYRGHKDKAHGMPLFALGTNIAWEVLYSLDGLFFHKADMIFAQDMANIVWAVFDIVIVVHYFMYGKDELPEHAQKYFVPYSILAFVVCTILQLAFYLHFDNGVEASQYSAFAQNAAMSILFVTMLIRRNNTKGQSFTIAFAKCIGTLAPTILGGFVATGFNWFMALTGCVCFIYDVLYITMLFHYNKKEKVAIF